MMLDNGIKYLQVFELEKEYYNMNERAKVDKEYSLEASDDMDYLLDEIKLITSTLLLN